MVELALVLKMVDLPRVRVLLDTASLAGAWCHTPSFQRQKGCK